MSEQQQYLPILKAFSILFLGWSLCTCAIQFLELVIAIVEGYNPGMTALRLFAKSSYVVCAAGMLFFSHKQLQSIKENPNEA